MSASHYIGIDIGGTKTNIGLIDEAGQIVECEKVITQMSGEDSFHAIKRIIETTKSMVDHLDSEIKVESVGIGIPGTVERKEGTVLFAPNLGWKDVPIKKLFSAVFSQPIYVGQDTEAAALGEFLFGAGKGLNNMICITIGTGVGCGLVLDGKLYKGRFFTAGEFGHTLVEKDGLPCNCGKKGCLEAYASGTAILKRFKMKVDEGSYSSLLEKLNVDDIRTEDIFVEAKQGDSLAIAIINDAINYLSMGITNAVNLLGPEAIILSGGIGSEQELFIEPLIKKSNSAIYSLLVDKVKIANADLGEYAPLVGAAMLFKDPLYNT
ncbi:ROK family protein [Neobacillus sp. NPDC093127]|uniref:ROK family protein n=1 Tax=Neobacillus sp. NPDC093127 TaxID=3364296 RepID=UPI0037FDC6A8